MKKILFILMAGFLTLSVSAQSYKIIVNNANSTTSISKKDASNFFMKKTSKWADGTKLAPVDQKAGSSVRNEFTRSVHAKNVSAVKSYWQQAIFSGKGTPPAELVTDAAVIEFVKGNSGAIGYVSSGANTDGVKVISIN